jgi:hypothetical protein
VTHQELAHCPPPPVAQPGGPGPGLARPVAWDWPGPSPASPGAAGDSLQCHRPLGRPQRREAPPRPLATPRPWPRPLGGTESGRVGVASSGDLSAGQENF